MFDAMNIQKYDDTSVRCKRLKKFANYENVKIISSRDGEYGVNRLNKDYIYNKKIKILPVGDPALWIPECYKINKSDNNNIVGINIIREGIFKDYSGDISENRVIKFYCELINAFENKNIPYKLFTNGMTDDYKTACNILRKLDKNDKVSEIIVPKNDLDNVKIISNFNKIVGARLHACICAYALDIPVVGFIWDEKLKHFALCNKIEDNFVSDKEFIADIVVNKLETTDENCYNNKIRNNWKQLTLDSIRQFFNII